MTRVRVSLLSVAVAAGVLVTIGAAGGPDPEQRRDSVRPSQPFGLRVNSSGGSSILAWEPSTDNKRVVAYDVRFGSPRWSRVTTPEFRLRGVPCGRVAMARVVAIDEARNRSRPARATVHVPGCSHSTPGWFGGFESGDLSEWDHLHSTAGPARFQAVRSDGSVTPRQGEFMGRVEVRGNEAAPWCSSCNVAAVEKHGDGELGRPHGSEVYWGFSVFLPRDFPYVPKHFFNTIASWHGDNGGQAPMHLLVDSVIGSHYGISNRRVGFVADLHIEPFTYRPRMFRLGDLVTGRWVDFVFRLKWHLTDGVYEGWMDGVKKFSYAGRTWPSSTTWVKPQLGYYRLKDPRTAVLFVDAYKIGASYRAVAP